MSSAMANSHVRTVSYVTPGSRHLIRSNRQEIQDYREECIFSAKRRQNKDRGGHNLERIQARLPCIENLLPQSNKSSPTQMLEREADQSASQNGEMENPVQQLRSPLPIDEVAVAAHAPSGPLPMNRTLPGAGDDSAWLPPTPSMTTAQTGLTGEDDGSCCVPPEEEVRSQPRKPLFMAQE